MEAAVQHTDIDDITQLLQLYFDGLFRSDAALLARVFHPDAHYVCASDGELLQWDMPRYFDVVAQRKSPASLGQQRVDHIQSIQFAGPVTALAVVNCAIEPKFFTDFLSLIKLDDQWRIIAKVFHFQLNSNPKLLGEQQCPT